MLRRLAVLTGAVLLIAGCGQSGDDSTASPTAAPTVVAPAPAAPSELGSCIVGTWDLDFGFFEAMLMDSTRASMERDQLGGTIESTSFSAVQTTTFAADGTFSTQVSLSTKMAIEITDFEGSDLPAELKGQKIPASYDSAGTAKGTWTADADSFSTTVEESDIDGTMTLDGEPVDGPGAIPVLLPDQPVPATCSLSTLIIPIGQQNIHPAFPEELVFSRHE